MTKADFELVGATSDAADSMDRLVNRREKRSSESEHQSDVELGEADTEEMRAEQFSNLRAIMYDLKQLDTKLSNFMHSADFASGSEPPATSAVRRSTRTGKSR